MEDRRFVKPQILTEGGAANWDWNYARLASHRAELLSMISSQNCLIWTSPLPTKFYKFKVHLQGIRHYTFNEYSQLRPFGPSLLAPAPRVHYKYYVQILSTEKVPQYRGTRTGDLVGSRRVHRHPYCRVFKLKQSKNEKIRIFKKPDFPVRIRIR